MSTKAVDSDSAITTDGTRQAARDAVGLDTEQDIELVLAFLNTRDAESGTEVLDDPTAWRRWCIDKGAGRAPDLAPSREARDMMRASITCDTEVHNTAPTVPPEWSVRVTLHGGVPVLTSDDAVGSVLVAAARLVTTGHWDRFKICPATDCLWAFYDRSRNRSRTWCSMRVCGNREKARSWRERHVSP